MDLQWLSVERDWPAVERNARAQLAGGPDPRQRERLERLADAIGATLPWFQTTSRCRSLEDLLLQPPPPSARQAAILAQLYFPALVEPTANYANALILYHCLAIECLNGDCLLPSVGAQMIAATHSDPKAKETRDAAHDLRDTLDQAIAAEAKKYSHV